MSLSAQENQLAGHSTDLVRRRRYKAEIGFVSPISSRSTFEEHGTCFLGVSLENSNFKTAKLEAMLKWISRRFSHCTVLIGDSIHRITLESNGTRSGRDALEHATLLGRRFIRDQAPVFDAYREQTKFTFLTCGEVQTWKPYAVYHQELRELFAHDEVFRSSVESFGRSYHSKHFSNSDTAEFECRIRMSSQYFLEEFAIFACLRREGIPVMVYPGSFSTLSEIARGEHPGTPEELRRLIVVSLHLKGR